MNKKPEILAPVQDFTSLTAAIQGKADSIYFGLKELNMRLNAKNFELRDIKKISDICEKHKIKRYLTLNSIVYQSELAKLKKILKTVKPYINAVTCWDYAVIREAENQDIPIHLSTQASISNFGSIFFLKEKIKNLKRVNLARECSLDGIKTILKQIKKHNLNVEIETFIHGAMCVSLSGRCFLSQFSFNKSANRGDCLQPCRRAYNIRDTENEVEYELNNQYILSPKDLCTMPFIEKLIEAGIDAFKIEGRNRSPEYVKTTTSAYRDIIDYYFYLKNKKITGNELDTLLKNKKQLLMQKLASVYNRGFSSGFYLGKPINEWTDEYGSKATEKKVFVGYVKNFYNKPSVAEIHIQSHPLSLGDRIMIQGPTTGVIEQSVSSMQINNSPVNASGKGKIIGIKLEKKARKNDKVYIIKTV